MGTGCGAPNTLFLKEEFFKEAYNSAFTTHPRSTKMYYNLKTHSWWVGIKRDIVNFIV